MGALISNLKGGSAESLIDAPLNSEASEVGSKEQPIFSEISELQRPMQEILHLIREYKGCTEEIREAISNPSNESDVKVWEALQPSISNSVKMYKFGTLIVNYSKKIIDFYCNEGNVSRTIEENPGLARLLIKTFSFIVDFDELKTRNSDLQNDFSYYRRSINKFKMMKGSNQFKSMITDEEANYISLFFAHHTPMFNSLSQSFSDYVNKNPDNAPKLFSFLAILTGSSYHSIIKIRYRKPETQDTLLRTMVTSTLLYDTVHSDGVFVKNSLIDVKPVIKAVNMSNSASKDSLMNSLRFNFTHLNDKTTPKQVKTLLNIS